MRTRALVRAVAASLGAALALGVVQGPATAAAERGPAAPPAGAASTASRSAAKTPAQPTPQQKAKTITPTADQQAQLKAMADAAAQAKATKKPVLVDLATTEFSTLTAEPDGSFTENQTVAPQRVRQGGRWTSIDTTLAASADGSARPKATVAGIRISGGGAGPLATVDDHAGHVLTLTWPGKLPKPTLSGPAATYAEVYPGVDLVVSATPDSVSDVLVVKNARAAADPALKTLHLGVSATGLSLATTSSGAIALTDSSGKVVYGSGTPRMWDSSSSAPQPGAPASNAASAVSDPRSAAMPAHKAGNGVDLTPDQSLLKNPGVKFPMFLDPTVGVPSQHHAELRECNDGNQVNTSFYDMPDSGSFGNGDVVRVGAQPGCSSSASGLSRVYALLQFDTSFLYNNRALVLNWANVNLTRQYPRPTTAQSSCATTALWAINPFYPGVTWANSGVTTGSGVYSGAHQIDTGWCGSGNAGWYGLNDMPQLTKLYDTSVNDSSGPNPPSWSGIHAPTVTVALQPYYQGSKAQEGWQSFCVSHLYYNPGNGHDVCANSGTDANLAVNFYTEPWEVSATASNAPVGIRGASTTTCGGPTNPGYLPAGNNTITLNGQIADFDPSRNLSYIYSLTPTDSNGFPNGPEFNIPNGIGNVSTGATQAYGNFPRGTAGTTISLPPATLDQTNPLTQLQDGQEYQLWIWTLDNDPAVNTAYDNVVGTSGWDAQIEFQMCYFKYAKTAPTQPQFGTGSTFLPTGTPASAYPSGTYPLSGAGDGNVVVSATAAHTPIDHFDYAVNNSSVNIGLRTDGSSSCFPADACGRVPVNRSTGTVPANIPIKADTQQGGTNYVYVTAVDVAGNVSWFGEYDYFLASPYKKTVFGDVTGDGIPDIMALMRGADGHLHLKTLPANTDPTLAANNWVEAAPDSAAPAANFGGTNWDGALVTHLGAERVQPVDDMFAWQNGHLYYYFNGAKAGQTLPVDAFTQTKQGIVSRPACSGPCPSGYDPTTWNNVKQIVALGPVAGGCDVNAPTTACKTNLITVEDDGHNGAARLFLFSPAGIGQLRSPQLIGTSDGSINWATAKLINPGPAGNKAQPDLWALDVNGTLWRYANRPGDPTGLGDSTTRTMIGQPGQFKAFQTIAPAGDVNGDGFPDAYGVTTHGQIQLFLGSGSGASFTLSPGGTYRAGAVAPLSAPGFTAATVGGGTAIASLNGVALTPGASGPLVWAVNSGTTQYCLDDLNGNTTNDSSVVDIFACNGTGPQVWTFNPNGTVSPALATGKCLDTGGLAHDGSGNVTGAQVTPNMVGAHITLHDCDPARAGNQSWQLLSNPTSALPAGQALYNPASGLCLDDPNYSTTEGTQFGLYYCGQGDTAQIFNPPAVPGSAQTTEAESIWNPAVSNGTASIQANCCGVSWSNGAQWWFISSTANSTFSLSYYVPAAGTYQVVPAMTKAVNYGTVALTIDPGAQQQALPSMMDGYHDGVMVAPFDFGTATLSAGVHTFTFTVTGTNSASTGNRYELGVDTISLVPTTSTAPVASMTLTPSAGPAPLAVTADASGSVAGVKAIATYTFDFGDGTVVGPQPAPTAQHTYAAGVYTASVTVTDSAGVSVTTSHPVYAFAPPTGLASTDGTTNASCATTASSAPTMASLTPTLSATVGTGLTAQFELRDITDPSIAPPIVIGGAGSAGSAAPNAMLTTPALVNGHEYGFAARSVDANGDVSPVSTTCYFWALTSGSQATATGAVGLPFDNTMYPAAATQTWTGPVTTLIWTNGGLVLHRNSDNAVLWASGTSGSNNVLALQNDGNAVIYSSQPTVGNNGWISGTPLWNTNTSGQGATSLLLAVDGTLTVRGGTTVLWNAPIATHLWALNDGQGRTAADTGFVAGSPATLDTVGVSWPSTSYAAFAGTNRIATSGPVLDTTKSFTVSAWVNLASATGSYQTMLVQQATTNSAFYLEYNGSNWQFAMPTADTTSPPITRITSTNAATAGTWTHLIGTYDATSGRMALYVNGAPNSTGTVANSIASTGIFAMGRGFSGGVVGNRFKGSMADVRVYQQAVSDSQAASMYQSSTFAKPAVPGIAGALISDDSATGQQICVDDLNGNLTNSTTVIDVYACNGTWPQSWQFAADGTIRIMGSNPASPPNKCLDTGGANTQGSKVTLFDCQPGNGNQQWKIVPSTSAPGRIFLQNPLTGMCLDNTNGSTGNTNPFQLYSCLDNANQHFIPPTTVGGDQKAEAESLWGSASGGTMQIQTGSEYSNGAQQFLGNTAAGSSITLNMYVANPGRYAVTPLMTKAADYGTVTLSVDGTALPLTFDGYNSGIVTQQFDFGGTVTLAAGMHSFTFTVTGTNTASTGNRYNAGIDTLTLQPTAR